MVATLLFEEDAYSKVIDAFCDPSAIHPLSDGKIMTLAPCHMELEELSNSLHQPYKTLLWNADNRTADCIFAPIAVHGRKMTTSMVILDCISAAKETEKIHFVIHKELTDLLH